MARDRIRYIVGATKIPSEQRDVAHAVITEEDPRGFADVINADDDPDVPIGAEVVYAVDLTKDEAERFREASNLRYLEEDRPNRPAVVDVEPLVGAAAAGDQTIPPDSTMRYMGAADYEDTWHGRDVTVAVLDGGTTRPVRDRFAWQLLAHRDFTGGGRTQDQITVDHGCMTTPLAVPPGGKLVQGVVFDAEGSAYNSWIAAAVKWAVDSGATVINFSGGGGGASAAIADAFRYAAAHGAVIVASAGNSGEPTLEYPARYSETIGTHVASSIAFTEATDRRAEFSNHAATGSGCAPGDRVLSVGQDAAPVRVSGTSFSSPHMARLLAMCCTGGRYAPNSALGALVSSARDTPADKADEGAGAWHLERALRALGALTANPGTDPEPDPLDDFPFTELDNWVGHRSVAWTSYARRAADSYTTWRRRHPTT